MLTAVTIVLILSPLLVLGNFFEYMDYPILCSKETLTLKGCCSGTISANFIEYPNLRCVSIVNNDIRSLEEGSFDGLPNLIYLNLEGNVIPPSKLFSFGNISNIMALGLNDQRTNSYYDTVLQVNTMYPKLVYLNLRNAKISRISNTVFGNPFPKLSYLDLSFNKLSSFNFEQLWNDSLVYLNLNHNQISKVSFNKLNNLISLNLVDNAIKSIGDGYDLDLRGLSSLEHLSIANNRINFISKTAFNHTVKLPYLNISDNALTALSPELFTPLTSLDVLILDNNKFNDIPLIISNISTLSMNCNNITYLKPSSLDMLLNLRKLSLAGNKISNIYPGTFKSQVLLEELYLNDNELTHLSRSWYQSMKKLRYLNLSGNKFTSIESVLDLANVALKEVYLAGNPIMFIETGSLKTVPQNLTIYLNMNETRPTSFCRRSYSELSLQQ